MADNYPLPLPNKVDAAPLRVASTQGLTATEFNNLTNVATLLKGQTVDARYYGCVGDGVINNVPFVTAALVDLATAGGGTLLFTKGTYYFASSLSIPTNVTVECASGAVLYVGSAVTLTINGPFVAPLTTVFQYFGSGVVVLGNAPKFYPQWWGAVLDGATDNTVAMQRALVAAGVSGGTVFLSKGTSIVSPTTTVRLVVASNTVVEGDGPDSVLKIKNNAGDYACIFGAFDNSTSVSDVLFRNFKIDQNATGNTTCAINSGNALIAQNAIRFYIGSNIHVRSVIFDSCCAVNTIALNGSSTLERFSVKDCYFRWVATTGTLNYDNSTIYANGADHEIVGNTFETAIASGARAAIETHTGPSVVTANRIDGYLDGINIVGEDAGTPISNCLNVYGNTISNVTRGIRGWSITGRTTRDISISNNIISINQVTRAITDQCCGIELYNLTGLDGAYEDVSITDNIITHEEELPAGRTWTNPAQTAGINCYQRGNVTGLVIDGNIVKNAPVSGIKVGSATTGLPKDVRLTNNVVINFGQNTVVTADFRAAFFFAATELRDLVIEGNMIRDEFTTRRGQRDIYFSGTATRVVFKGNQTGALDGTSFGRNINSAAVLIEPQNVTLSGSTTFDWASIAAGAQATTTVTVTQAALGDSVTAVSMSVDLQGMTMTGYVSAANTVTVVMRNGTAGAIDLASATIRVFVTKLV